MLTTGLSEKAMGKRKMVDPPAEALPPPILAVPRFPTDTSQDELIARQMQEEWNREAAAAADAAAAVAAEAAEAARLSEQSNAYSALLDNLDAGYIGASPDGLFGSEDDDYDSVHEISSPPTPTEATFRARPVRRIKVDPEEEDLEVEREQALRALFGDSEDDPWEAMECGLPALAADASDAAEGQTETGERPLGAPRPKPVALEVEPVD